MLVALALCGFAGSLAWMVVLLKRAAWAFLMTALDGAAEDMP